MPPCPHDDGTAGTLAEGEFEVDTLCLEVDTCYTMTVTGTFMFSSEILWSMCGITGMHPLMIRYICTKTY
jgi:hypothetical protein